MTGDVRRPAHEVDISTVPVPTGVADLRVLGSSPVVVTDPRTSLNRAILGTTREGPPEQSTNGGGFNSSLSASTITPATPLLPGGTRDFQFLLGTRQTGSYKFYVNVEVLPWRPRASGRLKGGGGATRQTAGRAARSLLYFLKRGSCR